MKTAAIMMKIESRLATEADTEAVEAATEVAEVEVHMRTISTGLRPVTLK